MPKAGILTVAQDQHERALALFRAGEHQEAARILGELLETGETAEIWNDWATARLMCNHLIDSERGYRRALEIDPCNNRAAGNLGALLAKNGYIAEALPFLETAAKTSSGDEREHLLCLIQSYRRQLALAPAVNIAGPALMLQVAQAIHQQSLAIAALASRVSALEAATSQRSSNSQASASAMAKPVAAVLENVSSPTAPGKRLKSQSRPKPGVLFCGPIYGGSGYAEESRAGVVALDHHGIPLQLEPVGEKTDNKNLLPQEAREQLQALERKSVDIPNSIVYQAAPAYFWDMTRFGRTCIGRTMYETDRIPDSFRDPCNAMDEVWVPSRLNMETFVAGGVNPGKLRFVPGGIDTAIFRSGVEPLNIPQKRSFNFVSVFAWHEGKGYDILLRAYLREFKPDDDVALILKAYPLIDRTNDLAPVITHFIEREVRLSLEKAPTVILINGFMTQKDMVRFYAAANCFVLPTHGEGYGRPFLEAMACEMPVIATSWGGQMDFMNRGNSYLIDCKLVEVPPDVEVNVSAGHRWAAPDEDHLRALMREVYSHRDQAHRKAAQGRQDVVRNYDWSAVTPLWVHEFERLLS
ncbi:MAG: glycosyltransferase [Terriglobia bacterium]